MAGERLSPKHIVFAAILLYEAGLFVYLIGNAHFVGDDYFHFILAKERDSLASYLLAPIDVHLVPLHRLFSFLTYELFPLNYAVALTILFAFHIAAILVLYRVLELLKPSPWNLALLLLFVTDSFLPPTIIWWSAGLHRIPYVLLALTAIYFYLRARERNSGSHVALCTGAVLCGVLFYVKAVLIPVYLLLIEIGLAARSRGRLDWSAARRLLPPALPVVAFLLTYPFLQRSFEFVILRFDLPYFLGLGIKVFINGFVGGVVGGEIPGIHPSHLVVILLAAATIRSRRDTLVWFLALVAVALNLLVLGMSSRRQMFGALILLQARYHFDTSFIFIVFLGMAVVDRLAGWRVTDHLWAGHKSRRPWLAIGVLVAVVGLLVVGRTVGYRRFIPASYGTHLLAGQYMPNLIGDWRRLMEPEPREPPVFVDLKVPRYIIGFLRERSYSVLFRVFKEEVKFVQVPTDGYVVDTRGRIRRIDFSAFESLRSVDLRTAAELRTENVTIDGDGCVTIEGKRGFVELPVPGGLEGDLVFVRIRHKAQSPSRVSLFYARAGDEFKERGRNLFVLTPGRDRESFALNTRTFGTVMEKVKLEFRNPGQPICIEGMELGQYRMTPAGAW